MKLSSRIITILAIILFCTVANKQQAVHASAKAVLKDCDFVLKKNNNADKMLIAGQYSMAKGETCKLTVENFRFTPQVNSFSKTIVYSSSDLESAKIFNKNGVCYISALKAVNQPVTISAKITVRGTAGVSYKVLVKKIRVIIKSDESSNEQTDENCKHPYSINQYVYVNPSYHKYEKRCARCNALLDYRYERHSKLCRRCAK